MACRSTAKFIALLGLSVGQLWTAFAAAAHEVIAIGPTGAAAEARREIEFQAAFPAGGPLYKSYRNVSNATLTVYRPDSGKANGTAVVVCPGGGYRFLAWELEGTRIAEWLVARGITAFILKYRLKPTPVDPDEFARETLTTRAARDADLDAWLESMRPYRMMAAADAHQAMKLVRERASRWNVAPDRIGMLGFSAGAGLAMGVIMEDDAASRPSFAAVLYGFNFDARAVPMNGPPLFLVATQADQLLPPDESVQIFSDWSRAGIAAELHMFAAGPHGFGTAKLGLPVDRWLDLFEAWLISRRLLPVATEPQAAAK